MKSTTVLLKTLSHRIMTFYLLVPGPYQFMEPHPKSFRARVVPWKRGCSFSIRTTSGHWKCISFRNHWAGAGVPGYIPVQIAPCTHPNEPRKNYGIPSVVSFAPCWCCDPQAKYGIPSHCSSWLKIGFLPQFYNLYHQDVLISDSRRPTKISISIEALTSKPKRAL